MILLWTRQGDVVTAGEYKITRKKYDRQWSIFNDKTRIGQAPLLYLAKEDAERYEEAKARNKNAHHR